MTIDKAIEVLDNLVKTLPGTLESDERDAVKLGIEALKRVKHLRNFWCRDLDLKLTGETAE